MYSEPFENREPADTVYCVVWCTVLSVIYISSDNEQLALTQLQLCVWLSALPFSLQTTKLNIPLTHTNT